MEDSVIRSPISRNVGPVLHCDSGLDLKPCRSTVSWNGGAVYGQTNNCPCELHVMRSIEPFENSSPPSDANSGSFDGDDHRTRTVNSIPADLQSVHYDAGILFTFHRSPLSRCWKSRSRSTGICSQQCPNDVCVFISDCDGCDVEIAAHRQATAQPPICRPLNTILQTTQYQA